MLWSNHGMPKEIVQWFPSLYDLVLYVLQFDGVLLWRRSGQAEVSDSDSFVCPQIPRLSGPADTVPVDTQGIVTQDLGGNGEAELLKQTPHRWTEV